MAKGRLKKRINKAVDKLTDKLQKDAKDIASIEVPEAPVESVVADEPVAAPAPAPVVEKKEEPQQSTDTWKIRVSDI